ncbi:TNF receptor-associated factor 4 [Chamberlinius hualienensis]
MDDEVAQSMWGFVTDKIQKMSEQFNAKLERIEEFLNKLNAKTDQLNIQVKSLQNNQSNAELKLNSLETKSEFLKEEILKKHEKMEFDCEENSSKIRNNFDEIRNRIVLNEEQTDNRFLDIFQQIGHLQIDFQNKFDKFDLEFDQINSKVENSIRTNNLLISSKEIEDEVKNSVTNLTEQQLGISQKLEQNSIKILELSDKLAKIDDEFLTEKLEYIVEENMTQMRIHLKELQLQCQNIHIQPTFSWKINGIDEILQKDTYECESEIFKVIGIPFKAKGMFEIREDGYIYISIAFLDGNLQDQPIPLKILPKVTYIFKDLTENDQDMIKTKERLLTSVINFNHFNYERMFKHKSSLQNSIYNKNDSMTIEIMVDGMQLSNSIVSNNGNLVWKIDNYSKNKQKAIDELICYDSSPYFYTSPTGYRVKVLMWLNGCDDYTGNGLTVAIGFLTGKFDSILNQSFPHKITITLFNQLDISKNIVRMIEMDIEDHLYYSIDIVSHDEIEKNGFIKDDCLFYNVTVQNQ